MDDDAAPALSRAKTWDCAASSSDDPPAAGADTEPLWLEQAAVRLQSSLTTLDASKVETERLRNALRQEQERLAEALEDLEVVQGERDELEAAVFEAHEVIAANAADSADEGSDGDDGASSGALERLVAERRRLQAEVRSLKVSLAERDALNAELLRKKAEQDAELERALEMNLKLVCRMAEIDARMPPLSATPTRRGGPTLP